MADEDLRGVATAHMHKSRVTGMQLYSAVAALVRIGDELKRIADVLEGAESPMTGALRVTGKGQ